MTVKIPMNDHLKGYKYYQAVIWATRWNALMQWWKVTSWCLRLPI